MAPADEALAVGLGEARVSREPGEILVAYGLGSCLGICMVDPVARVSGLLHAVLPERSNGAEALSPKYVDSGMAGLLTRMAEAGAERKRLIVRMAGGASMLSAPGLKPLLNIGERNIIAARAAFAALNIKVAAEDVGGTTGRTVRLYVATGRVTVRKMGGQEREL